MIDVMFQSLKISDLPRQNLGVLRKPTSTRPTLWLVEKNGVRAVVKDYSTNRVWYKNTIGRFLLWRESKAYRRLKGLRGVPTYYGVICEHTWTLEADLDIPWGKDLKKSCSLEIR